MMASCASGLSRLPGSRMTSSPCVLGALTICLRTPCTAQGEPVQETLLSKQGYVYSGSTALRAMLPCKVGRMLRLCTL